MRKLLRRFKIKTRAQARGLQIIAGRGPSAWSRWDHRQLIRLNRLASGLPAFHWDGKPRRVAAVFECQVSLYSFGNHATKPDLVDSLRDLIAYRLFESK